MKVRHARETSLQRDVDNPRLRVLLDPLAKSRLRSGFAALCRDSSHFYIRRVCQHDRSGVYFRHHHRKCYPPATDFAARGRTDCVRAVVDCSGWQWVGTTADLGLPSRRRCCGGRIDRNVYPKASARLVAGGGQRLVCHLSYAWLCDSGGLYIMQTVDRTWLGRSRSDGYTGPLLQRNLRSNYPRPRRKAFVAPPSNEEACFSHASIRKGGESVGNATGKDDRHRRMT